MLIRAEDQPPRVRRDYFRHVLAEAIAPFDPQFRCQDDFRGEIHSEPVGIAQVTRVSAPPMTAWRTPRLIRKSDPELFKIDVQLRGHTVYAQGEREAALRPGDLTLIDLSRPVQLTDHADHHEVLAVKFAHAALPLRHDELARLTAVPISGRDGLGAPISALARHVVRHLDDYAPTDGARLAAALMDLLIVALAERLDRGPSVPAATRRRALLASAQAFIERRLGDPELTPGVIAAENHVSLRYLHKLFESQETTVAGWIRQRRLERCRRDLRDPALSHWPVSAIAARWGLVDAAHFSRMFRAAYGVPPAEYRLAVNLS
jgi:AraC-like DNA-binding protein